MKTPHLYLAVVTSLSALYSGDACGDPPVPCVGTPLQMPRVFCFRVTDIRQEVDPVDDNTFTFEFEVLNWTFSDASALSMSLNAGTSSGIQLVPHPTFPSNTDTDLRPITLPGVNEDLNGNCTLDPGEDTNGNDRLDTPDPTCNYNGINPNDWEGTVTPTSVLYDGSCGTVIPPIDLVDCGGGITQAQLNARIPCVTATPSWRCVIDVAGNILPAPGAVAGVDGGELIDDGPNVLDGFLLTVDGFDPGTVVSLNWFLLFAEQIAGMPGAPLACPPGGTMGYPIGTAIAGNPFGFGVMNLTRVDPGGAVPGPIFEGNTGFTQRDFFDSVYNVNPEFFLELGASVTADFIVPGDNVFDAPINVVPFERLVPKWEQPPNENGGQDIPSNVDWSALLAGADPDVVAVDDFISDGRPIHGVRFWGSYLDPEFIPPRFEGPGDRQIDGWLISFHTDGGGAPDELLGLYFCPADRVTISRTGLTGCDGHEVFEYLARLRYSCPIHIDRVDERTQTVPAEVDRFLEVEGVAYWMGIQAVVGQTFVPPRCTMRGTPNQARADFWGWHTSFEQRESLALQGRVIMEGEDWFYPPEWSRFEDRCTSDDDQAFELLTIRSHRQLPGDCNQDGSVNVADAVCLLGKLFTGIPAACPCGDGTLTHPANLALLDWGGDAAVNISDAVGLLTFCFGMGPPHVRAVPGLEKSACINIPDCPDVCR